MRLITAPYWLSNIQGVLPSESSYVMLLRAGGMWQQAMMPSMLGMRFNNGDFNVQTNPAKPSTQVCSWKFPVLHDPT